MTGGMWTSGVSAPYKWTVITFLNTSVPLGFHDGDIRSIFNFIPPWLKAGNYKILIYSALKGKAGRKPPRKFSIPLNVSFHGQQMLFYIDLQKGSNVICLSRDTKGLSRDPS